MKCAADCRVCAWGDYFFDVAPPPFALSLRRSPAATSENKTRCESGGASQTFPAAASAVEPTEKHRAKPMAKLFMTVAERTSMVKAEQMRLRGVHSTSATQSHEVEACICQNGFEFRYLDQP